jgi:trans-aconitate 2-methyltransferase
MSGTALVPYFERLTEALRARFMLTYRERLRERWPLGPVLYPFRRTLFAATRDYGQLAPAPMRLQQG